MDVELLYGRGTIKVDLPRGVRPTIIEKHAMTPLDDPRGAIEQALDGLEIEAIGKRSACILVCDITRPVPNHLFLQPLIRRLLKGGVPADRITVLVATGLHRPNEGDELAELIGDPWVFETVTVANHFAERAEDHVDLGFTAKRRVPVKLDRRLVEADLKISTGLVEPHFMAGYSGGRKVIAPGVAHEDTIRTFHSSRFMADPLARNCNLEGNPLHEEQLAIVDLLGGALALNTVLDDKRRLAFVNFGEIKASHAEAVAFMRGYAEVRVPRRFKVVVTSSAGHPLDKTYYQTVKGMVGPLEILEPGGDLIIASACSEGLGSRHFAMAQKRLSELGPEGFWRSIEHKPFADIDEWQTQMQTKAMNAGRVRLVTDGLSPEELEIVAVEHSPSLEAALAQSLTDQRTDEVAIVPEGPYVVPVHG
ncbi:MAG: nickel-dependent lactate racemase [Geminicoccaceae bacterium]|nr:nickel-dependent lactate racemase [Geminicoccaceae bacterium]